MEHWTRNENNQRKLKWNWIRQHLYAILNERIDTIESSHRIAWNNRWKKPKFVSKNKQTTKKTHDSCLATKKSQYFHGWYKFKLKTLQRHCSSDVWCYQKRGPIIKYAFIVNIKQLWSLITFENTKRKKERVNSPNWKW